MNELIRDLKSSASLDGVDNGESYVLISVRSPEKTATMINVLSVALQKPVSSFLTNEISRQISIRILKDSSNIPLLEEFIENIPEATGSFLEILVEDGVLDKDHFA